MNVLHSFSSNPHCENESTGRNDSTGSVLRVKDDSLVLSAHFFLPGIQCRAEFEITDFGVNVGIEIPALPVINFIALKKSFFFSEL